MPIFMLFVKATANILYVEKKITLQNFKYHYLVDYTIRSAYFVTQFFLIHSSEKMDIFPF